MLGFQKKCVFRNLGGGGFADVADWTDFGRDRNDGRGVALIDPRNDGALGFAVANQKQDSRYYVTRPNPANRWAGFRLVGTRSPRDAYGAQVRITLAGEGGAPDRTLTRELQPLNGGASQSDDRLHFGLGPRPIVRAAEIRWPSGIRQRIAPASLALDAYQTVTEEETPR